jgi:ABC-2 type transport system permease protein
MRHIPALVRRELAAYFLGPMAYLILLAFQLLACVNFVELVESLSRPQSVYSAGNDPINLYIPASLGFWISVLVAVPILTMRLLAEERRSGTLETLMTVPVTEVEVVLSKWLAGFVMYLLLLLPFFFYLPFLRHFGNLPFDLGPIYALLIGLSTLGLMFVAIGLFFSALTRNQIVAAMSTFATLFVILILAVIEYGGAMRRQTSWAEGLRYLTVVSQVREFGLGQVDLRYLALHVSGAVFLLWMTVLVMRSRRGA